MSDDKTQDRIQRFDDAVDKRIKYLLNERGDKIKRAKAAEWLGEAGAPRSIPALVEVYQSGETDRELMKAVTYALGQYRALEKAVGADKTGSFEEALGDHPEVIERLRDIALKGKFGKRKSFGALWVVVLILLAVVAGLGGYNASVLLADADDPDEPELIVAPTDTATPAPTATEDGATAAPTATATVTPTPTIAPEDIEPYVRQMTDAIRDITLPRGAVETIEQNWIDFRDAGRTQGCRDRAPTIPEDVFIPENLLNEVDGLREVQTQVNVALSLLRQAWRLFEESCLAGAPIQPPEFVVDNIITTMLNAIDSARTQIRDLQVRSQ